MSGEVFLMGNGSVTKAAGVIRVSYPANSTLVVKGTSSGKQFAKDTNVTSSAKAYIFLAPIGNASYTLTATNSAGKTVSKQVYVAKDQVQSVVLAYDLILFDGTDNTDVTGGLKLQVGTYDSAVVSSAPISGGKITFNKTGYVGVYPAKKADITNYSTLRVELNFPVDSLYVARAGIISTDATPQEAMNASGGKHVAYQDLVKGANSLAIPVDKFSGSYQFLLMYYSDNGGQVSISNIRFT